MDSTFTVDEVGNGGYHVRVGGNVGIATAPALRATLAAVIDRGACGMLIDLSPATFIDSATLGTLMGAAKRLTPAGGRLAVACSDPSVRRIFEITRLDRLLTVVDTPAAGLAVLERACRRSDGDAP